MIEVAGQRAVCLTRRDPKWPGITRGSSYHHSRSKVSYLQVLIDFPWLPATVANWKRWALKTSKQVPNKRHALPGQEFYRAKTEEEESQQSILAAGPNCYFAPLQRRSSLIQTINKVDGLELSVRSNHLPAICSSIGLRLVWHGVLLLGAVSACQCGPRKYGID